MRSRESRGRVLSINISTRKGISKHPVAEAELVAGLGIKGDAHAGTPGREVSLLDRGEIAAFAREKGVRLKPGAFAENLTIEGLDLLSLRVGTELLVGEEVLLVISQVGKECHLGCAIREKVGDCIMPR
ncbi:TPA: MOSC domain-containing protein, partial [Candidatus Bipolaricaulota bacterium]|nr:MOSC domain-containing protein [Candidatus Bipolaricaulota bacterium]